MNMNTLRVEINSAFVRNSGVQFFLEALNDFSGSPYFDHAEFLEIIECSPYHDIRHTLCGVTSVARWDRVRDMGRHLTFHYRHLNLVAWVWINSVCRNLLSRKT